MCKEMSRVSAARCAMAVGTLEDVEALLTCTVTVVMSCFAHIIFWWLSRSLDMVVAKSPAAHKPSALSEQGFARSKQAEPSTIESGLFYRMMYKPKEGMFCLPEAATFQFGKKLQVSLAKHTDCLAKFTQLRGNLSQSKDVLLDHLLTQAGDLF